MTETAESGLLDPQAIEADLRWWHYHFSNIASVHPAIHLDEPRKLLNDCESWSAELGEATDYAQWTVQRYTRRSLQMSYSSMLDSYASAASQHEEPHVLARGESTHSRICDVSQAVETFDVGKFRELLVDLFGELEAVVGARRKAHRAEARLDTFVTSVRDLAQELFGGLLTANTDEDSLKWCVEVAFELRAKLRSRVATNPGSKVVSARRRGIEHTARRILHRVNQLLFGLGASPSDEDSELDGEVLEAVEGEDVLELETSILSVEAVGDRSFQLEEQSESDPKELLKSAVEAALELCRAVRGFAPILGAESQRAFDAVGYLNGAANKALEACQEADVSRGALVAAYEDLLIRFQWVRKPVVGQVTWAKVDARRGAQYRRAWVSQYRSHIELFVDRIGPVFEATSELHVRMRNVAKALGRPRPKRGFVLDAANRSTESLLTWINHVATQTDHIQSENEKSLAKVSDKRTVPGKLYLNPFIVVINGSLVPDEAPECDGEFDVHFDVRRGGKSIPKLKRAKRVVRGLRDGELYRGDVSVRDCPPEGKTFMGLALGEITDKQIRLGH